MTNNEALKGLYNENNKSSVNWIICFKHIKLKLELVTDSELEGIISGCKKSITFTKFKSCVINKLKSILKVKLASNIKKTNRTKLKS